MKRRSFIGSNLSKLSWDKIKKVAHDVWDMGTDGDKVLALRKKQDTARVSEESSGQDTFNDMISNGDIVFLYLGGKKVMAKVAGVANGKLTLDTDDGKLDDIPCEWVKRA